MSRSGRRILVDLAGPASPCERLHLESVLPALIAARHQDVVRFVGPGARLAQAAGWGAPVGGARRSGLLGEADLVLRPLSDVPLPTRVPQVLWSWHGPERGAHVGPRERLRTELALRVSGASSLLVHPTAAARLASETAGRTGPGLVLSPPVVGGHRTDRAGRTSPASDDAHLRVVVPAGGRRGDNLALLPRITAAMASRGTAVTFLADPASYDRSDPSALIGGVDAALLPAVDRVCAAELVQLEGLGLPVAASDVGTHRELRRRAVLFDPASPHGAAAALAAVTSQAVPREGEEPPPEPMAAADYVSVLSREMDRVIDREAPSWTV